MSAETEKPQIKNSSWRPFKNLFRRRKAVNNFCEGQRTALQARHEAEARRDEHQMTVRIHEPMF